MQFNWVHKMAVAAHRGDWYNHYENTMEAFQAAWEAGVDMVETDLRLTKDDQVVLIHDETVDRTSDITGLVREFTLAQLREVNVGDPENVRQVPTLEAFLQWAQPLPLLLNLELKEYDVPGNEGRWQLCADKAVAMVEQYGLGDRVVFNSFDAAVLEYIDEKYGHRYRLHGFYPYEKMTNVRRNPDEYLFCACLWGSLKRKEHYDYLLERGIQPWIGASVTSADALAMCCKYGATLVTTNYPAKTIELLKGTGNRL